MTPKQARAAADRLAQLYRDIAPRLRDALLHRGIRLHHACPVGPSDRLDLPSIDNGVAHFTDQVREAGALAVSREFCEGTIYPTALDNMWFRFVHDMAHMLYQCEFDTAGELELHPRLWNWIETQPLYWSLSHANQQMVYCVYMADTQGQTHYYAQHGCFPQDQAAFVIGDACRRHLLMTGGNNAQA